MFERTKMLCLKQLLLMVGVIVVTSTPIYGQHISSQSRFVFDHEANVTNTLVLGPKEMTSGILGDFINLDTGELSFRQPDVELKGNFDISVSVIRYIDSDDDRPKFTTSELAGGSTGTANWGLELPYILLHSIKKGGTVGCISSAHSVDMFDKLHLVPRLSVGRNKRWTLLKSGNSTNSEVFGISLPDNTTSTMWRINQTKKNGKCSWKAVAPDGKTYEFGQPYILAKRSDGAKKHAVLITKITDVHGNWVQYTYDKTHKRLKTITSSDERKIQLVYRSNHELEGIVANSRKWVYTYKKMSAGSNVKYLYRVTLPDGRYSEFDKLLGVSHYRSSFHAQRCIFGSGARIKHYTGTVGTYKTRKIVNFSEVSSQNGHLNNSHRAECLPPTDFFGTVFEDSVYRQILNSNGYLSSYYANQYLQNKINTAMSSASLSDGQSKFGNFSTYFTSAVSEKKLESPDGTSIIWTYDYDEGDLYNGDYSEKTSTKSVHKGGNVVEVDTSKPKKRTVTGPLGNKYEFNFGRSLHNTGALLSEIIYTKGSTKASRTVAYEYVHAKKKLGTAWDCSKPMPKPMDFKTINQNLNHDSTEKWRRVSKRTITQDGETYTVENEYDDRGSLTKTSEYSTIQKGTYVTKRKVLHLTSKWILDLTAKLTENGKEIRSYTHDANGKVILETRYGSQYQRTSWYSDGSRAAVRDGNNNTTKFENYKRGIAQKTTKPSGAILKKVVDANGWITSETDARGYTEIFSLDKMGRVIKIDRPTGYADSVITYSVASSRSGRTKSVTTGTGTQKLVEKTTFNIFGDELLVETRDVSNSTSVFVRSEFDKLGRKTFESMPASKSSETAGINATFDSLGRVTELKLSVSPFSKVGISYLSDNRIQITDPVGNKIVKHRSGYSTPVDGTVVLIEYPDGAKTTISHDSWHNVTSVQFKGDGKTLERSYKYDSLLQLCFQSIPESGTEAFTYDAARQKITSEKGVSSDYICQTPVTVSITKLPKPTTPSSSEKSTSKPVGTTPKQPATAKTCFSYMVWVPSYNKCMNAGIVTQCGEWILTSKTKNGCIYNPACAVNPHTNPYHSNYSYYPYYLIPNPSCVPLSLSSNPPINDPVSTNLIRYDYNFDGFLTSVDFPSGTPDISNTYDLGGNLIKTVSGDIEIAYTFGKRGELKSETLTVDNETYTVSYGYDTTGGRISYTSPSGRNVIYTLNAFNQITAISIGGVKYVSGATYYPNGVLYSANLHKTKVGENSDTITLTNTLNSRKLISYSTLKNTKMTIFSFSNTYFNDNRIKTVVDTLDVSSGAGNRTFTYSNRSFLKSAKGPLGVTTYTHDKFSNMLSQTNPSNTVVLDIDSTYNRVENYTKSATNLAISHDRHGRVTSFRGMNLSYDHADRLIGVTQSQTFEDHYYYDGNHNRAKIVENNSMTGINQKRHSFFSVEGRLLSRIAVLGSNSSEKRYSDLINFGDNLTLHIFSCSHWIYQSNTNNTVFSLKPNNSISATETIGPFGNSWGLSDETSNTNPCNDGQTSVSAVASSNTNNSRDSRVLSSQLFRNVERDINTELYLLSSQRFFDAFGRYLTPDSTIEWNGRAVVDFEKTNLYSIAENDPVNRNKRGFRELNEHFARLNRSSVVPMAHEFENYIQAE